LLRKNINSNIVDDLKADVEYKKTIKWDVYYFKKLEKKAKK